MEDKRFTKLLRTYTPGLIAAGVKHIYVNMEDYTFSTEPKENYQKIELTNKMIAKDKKEIYMMMDTPYPIFLKTRITKKKVSRLLSGMVKISEKNDPVLDEPLQFVNEDFWIEMYNSLKPVCVSCCPNGHALSLQSLCGFMLDDCWDSTEVHDIIKVKCPVCRKRYHVHESIILLARFFEALAENEIDEPSVKDDKIQTYFSTEEDEEDTTEIDNLRRLVENEDNEEENEEDEESEDEESEESDTTYVDENSSDGEGAHIRDLRDYINNTVKEDDQ